jgi:hypothetical protein
MIKLTLKQKAELLLIQSAALEQGQKGAYHQARELLAGHDSTGNMIDIDSQIESLSWLTDTELA